MGRGGFRGRGEGVGTPGGNMIQLSCILLFFKPTIIPVTNRDFCFEQITSSHAIS